MADAWKFVATACAALAASLLMAWVAFAKDVPDRAEVQDIVQTDSAYAVDRAFIRDKLEQITKLDERQRAIQVELARITTLLEEGR